MNKYPRRRFLQNSIVLASMAGRPPSRLALGAGEGRSKKEPIVEHFTGDFNSYVPLLIGNGDIGGTFDPFCGTWFDELRSVKDQTEDIRSLLQARFMAADFWELIHLDPKTMPLNEKTKKAIADGEYTEQSVARGSPFSLYLGPSDRDFPDGVDNHTQQLDIEQGILSSEYSFKGKRFRVECLVHPRLSLLAYRVQAGDAMEFRITWQPQEARDSWQEMAAEALKFRVNADGNVLMAQSISNIYNPAIAGIYAKPGQIDGNRIRLPLENSVLYLAYGHTSLGNPKGQIARALEEARQKGYDRLREETIRWWADFWGQSDVSLPDNRMQQMYYRSLYYIGASLGRKTKTPDGEMGLAGSFPTFETGYHIQDSVYHLWPMVNSNHLELAEPMLEWFLEVLPIAQENARSMFWLEGARYIWHGGPGMLPYTPGHAHAGCTDWEHHVNGWVVLAIERYLNASGWDKDKTRHYYPVVREIARFFSSMLEPASGDKLQIRYLPSHSQAESSDSVNKPNIFDVLVTAKWTLMVASQMSHLLGVDETEASRWKSEVERIDFSMLYRSDGAYALFEGDHGVRAKVCAQFTGIIFPVGLDRQSLVSTYKYLQKHVIFGSCSWDPGYAAISLARLGETELASKHLSRIFNENYTEEPWIMFRESAPFWLGARRGNMPYYLAAHGLFAQAIHEMLIQDWKGNIEVFPACPFEKVSFRLRAHNQIVEATKVGAKVTRVDRVAS